MKSYALTQVPSPVLLRDLVSLVAKDRLNTADLLAHLGEVEARRLYAPASCSSMHVYCVKVLRLSEDAAGKRLTAARAARRFPVLFQAVADGRLHLSAVVLLAPHLDRENHQELVAAASHRTKREIEELVAARFPRPDVQTQIRPIEPTGAPLARTEPGTHAERSAPGRIENPNEMPNVPTPAGDEGAEPADTVPAPAPAASAPAPVSAAFSAPASTPAPSDRARIAPLAADRFALQVTISRATRDKLVRAQELLGFSIRPGDVAELLDRALDLLVAKLEARKRGLTPRPLKSTRRPSKLSRHVTNEDLRFIEERDGGQCTYVGADGKRCEERFALEPHHDESFAKGGPTTRDNLFLRCPTHNQLAAEEEFGPTCTGSATSVARASRGSAPSCRRAGRGAHAKRRGRERGLRRRKPQPTPRKLVRTPRPPPRRRVVTSTRCSPGPRCPPNRPTPRRPAPRDAGARVASSGAGRRWSRGAHPRRGHAAIARVRVCRSPLPRLFSRPLSRRQRHVPVLQGFPEALPGRRTPGRQARVRVRQARLAELGRVRRTAASHQPHRGQGGPHLDAELLTGA